MNRNQQRIVFGLGSNLGDKSSYLNQAINQLEKALVLSNLKVSEIFKNPALLLPDSPKEWDQEFYNIALSANINLEQFTPEKILQIIKKIEKNLGRKDGAKWSPREIDIDILAIGDLKIAIDGMLTIPHPGLAERDFFLKTFAEIEPELLLNLSSHS